MKLRFLGLLTGCLMLGSWGMGAPKALGAGVSSVNWNCLQRSATCNVVKTHPSQDPRLQELTATILVFLYLMVPAGIGLSLFLSDQYQAYHTRLLKRQRELLERLWEQGAHY